MGWNTFRINQLINLPIIYGCCLMNYIFENYVQFEEKETKWLCFENW